jgi:hypothetical protein
VSKTSSLILAVAAVAAALALPGIASAGIARGVVVKIDRAPALVAVAQANGRVSLLHVRAGKNLHVGSRIAFTARVRRDGTLATTGVRVVGRAGATRVRGIVLAWRQRTLVISARGAILRVKAAKGVRGLASAASRAPKVGAEVQVRLDLRQGALTARGVSVVNAETPAGSIEGHILAITPNSITVADDGVSVLIGVPSGFDLTKFKVGDEVLASFTRNTDGSLTLTALANEDAADDQEPETGDDNGDDQGQQGDDHGDDQPSTPGTDDGDNDNSGGDDGGSGGGGHDDDHGDDQGGDDH